MISPKDDSPKTGDGSGMMLYQILAAGSLGVLVLMNRFRKSGKASR